MTAAMDKDKSIVASNVLKEMYSKQFIGSRGHGMWRRKREKCGFVKQTVEDDEEMFSFG